MTRKGAQEKTVLCLTRNRDRILLLPQKQAWKITQLNREHRLKDEQREGWEKTNKFLLR